jgi:hypothetical protein
MLLLKREAGENPARTRRCNAGALFQYVTGKSREDEMKVMIAKSEDLPVMMLWGHE